MTDDSYSFWRRALAGEKVGTDLPLSEGEYHWGFWRKRTAKAGPFVPVAIWGTENGTVCLVDGQPADPAEVFSYCCRHAVTEAQYRERVATGKWFDEDDSIAASLEPPPAGHNQADKFSTLYDQIEAALQGIEAYKEILDDTAEAKAQSKRSRLNDLSGDADKERETLKRPHLDAGTAIDKRWQPIIKSAKAGADAIKKAMDAYSTKKLNAEKKRLADEQAKALEAARKHGPLGADLEVEAAPMPSASAVVAAPVKGAYGRAASKRVVKVFVMEDQDRVYQHFRDNMELKAMLQAKAQTFVTAGFDVPGGRIEEEVRTV